MPPPSIAPEPALKPSLKVNPPVTSPSTYPFEAASVEAETVSIPVILPVPNIVISPPETVKSPATVTSVGKPTVTLPLFPVDSVIAISPVVPLIVTEDLIPEPVPPAVKLRTAVFAAPAAVSYTHLTLPTKA